MQSVEFHQATKFQIIDLGYIIPCLQPIFEDKIIVKKLISS